MTHKLMCFVLLSLKNPIISLLSESYLQQRNNMNGFMMAVICEIECIETRRTKLAFSIHRNETVIVELLFNRNIKTQKEFTQLKMGVNRTKLTSLCLKKSRMKEDDMNVLYPNITCSSLTTNPRASYIYNECFSRPSHQKQTTEELLSFSLL